MSKRRAFSFLCLLALSFLVYVAPGASAGLVPGTTLRYWSPENAASSHGPTLSQAVATAQAFDLITPLKGTYRDEVTQMKQANPNLMMLVYMNGTLAQKFEGEIFPDDWYVKDAGGNHIISNSQGNYLMNPNHPGWIANRIQQALDFLAVSGYDGVLMDTMGTGPIGEQYSSGIPIDPSTGLPWTKSDWLKATSSLAAKVKLAVGDRPVIVNGLGSGVRYYDAKAPTLQLLAGIDGGHAEAFLRNANEPVTRYPSPIEWKKEVDMLVDAASRGKIVLTQTKVWSEATTAQKDAWHRYALASFLMGAGPKTYFTFFYTRNDDPTVAPAMWNVDLGSPTSAYTALRNGAYRRTFKKGMALVNPGTAPVTIDFRSSYRTLEGDLVTSLTLGPNEGNVLVKER